MVLSKNKECFYFCLILLLWFFRTDSKSSSYRLCASSFKSTVIPFSMWLGQLSMTNHISNSSLWGEAMGWQKGKQKSKHLLCPTLPDFNSTNSTEGLHMCTLLAMLLYRTHWNPVFSKLYWTIWLCRMQDGAPRSNALGGWWSCLLAEQDF